MGRGRSSTSDTTSSLLFALLCSSLLSFGSCRVVLTPRDARNSSSSCSHVVMCVAPSLIKSSLSQRLHVPNDCCRQILCLSIPRRCAASLSPGGSSPVHIERTLFFHPVFCFDPVITMFCCKSSALPPWQEPLTLSFRSRSHHVLPYIACRPRLTLLFHFFS